MKKRMRRIQISIYLSEQEKQLLHDLSKRLKRTPAQLVRDLIIVVSANPQYDYLFDKKVLFNPDPNEMILMKNIMPEISKVVKKILDIKNDEKN